MVIITRVVCKTVRLWSQHSILPATLEEGVLKCGMNSVSTLLLVPAKTDGVFVCWGWGVWGSPNTLITRVPFRARSGIVTHCFSFPPAFVNEVLCTVDFFVWFLSFFFLFFFVSY